MSRPKPEHSPLPWYIHSEHPMSGVAIGSIKHPTDRFVAAAYGAGDPSIALINARYIVQACNSFPALLAALEAYVASEECIDTPDTNDSSAYRADPEHAAKCHWCRMQRALSSARGEV